MSKKADRLARARAMGKKFAAGTKGTLYSGATGAVCFYAGKELTKRSETLQKSPYAVPILFAVGGHLLKKRQYDAGSAMVGVAGFVAAQVYDSHKQAEDAKKLDGLKTDGVMTPGATPASGVIGDTGWTTMDVPMLREAAGKLEGFGQRQREAAGMVDTSSNDAAMRALMALSDL